ncbi:hypothetical protein ACO22_00073 [Paracoccidioides brasiliensis]|uniref:RNA helicase n=1 Tax=Paracoccidioides brasiliensis TaxID=121759 RepID=A0A1D2JQ51_PARBR|nr:hypothetical protein ACO22_00073 [Paracoccidioides brasiliensis]
MQKFVPRQRKHKNKLKGNQDAAQQDTNVTELAASYKSEKEKRQKLKAELQAQQQPKISGKKQKRLAKYIETKLKKDENLALLKKLAESKIDTSQLQSSRNLGKSKDKRSRSSALNNKDSSGSVQRAPSYDNEGDAIKPVKSASVNKSTSVVSCHINPSISAIGSGLKRPLEVGEDGFPVIKKRKRAPKRKLILEEPSWEGFESDEASNAATEDSGAGSGSGMSDSGTDGSGNNMKPGHSESEDGEEDEGDDQPPSSADDSGKERVIRPRNSAFKAWAVQQINDAVGFKPTEHNLHPDPLPLPKKQARPLPVEEEPLPAELQIPKGNPNRKAFAVQVNRPENIQSSRLGLPVVGEEQKIMEAIHNNPCVVIWGATGSGKTTQLPQFLFEAGYGNPDSPNPGMIGITQPRRVAAVSMAKRVADELGQYSDQVSYQIRFESTESSKTAIKFMTDGVMIREIAQDFSLSKYSIIIIDEAHERSVNTDILIGMVSRIVDLRKTIHEENSSLKPLKLVIMSATLRISDFLQNENLFRQGRPPLVQAEGRQYPVTIHFARRTHRDYVEEAFRKVSKGHKKLPPGAFLVFLTGQGEIKDLSKRLKQKFRSTHASETFQGKVKLSAAEAPLETEDIELGTTTGAGGDEDGDSDIEITGLDNDENDDDDFDHEEGVVDSRTKVHVLPLYSQLPTKEQMKVFEPPPEGSRLIVLATNVAETSLTIPGIRYVFDCGRSKEKQYDVSTGVQSFQVGWISKASASQRAGRAGRTGPGHCYRLYSSAVFEGEFEEYTEPEILRTPIEGVVLQMKTMGLHHVINFPFPTPPNRTSLANAEKLLRNLGALSVDGQVTETGRHLSLYPLSPRFGKMLQIGHQHGCIPYVVAMVSALAVSDLFIQENQLDLNPVKKEGDEDDKIYTNADRLEDTAREMRRKDYDRSRRIFSKYDDKSDALKSLAAVCAYAYASDGESFCSQMFLRPNAMKEASQLRQQLYEIVRSNNPGIMDPFKSRLPEPSEKQLRALKQITAAGFIDHIAIRADMAPVPPEIPRKPRRAIDVPYLTLFSSRDKPAKGLDEKAVYIHPASVLSHLSVAELPQYLIYSHLQQSTPNAISDTPTKVRMFPLTAVSGLQLSALAHGTPLVEYGKPIGKIESVAGAPDKRECWVIPFLKGDPGSVGWPLPAKKVKQERDRKHGWVIEKFIK